MIKKVLVPFVLRVADQGLGAFNGARATYIAKLAKYNMVPVFVSPSMSPEGIKSLYQICQGALFMGGNDFDASFYNETNHELNRHPEAERDLLEISLLKMILKDKKPFLGICRGCQALAIAGGGSLTQHIPDLNTGENHSSQNYDQLLDNTAARHKIKINKASRAFQIIGQEEVEVNSGHHQCVNKLSPEFVVAAASPAGIPEIIEHTDPDYFCFGVQSHPEAEDNGALESFFLKFSEALETYATGPQITDKVFAS